MVRKVTVIMLAVLVLFTLPLLGKSVARAAEPPGIVTKVGWDGPWPNSANNERPQWFMMSEAADACGTYVLPNGDVGEFAHQEFYFRVHRGQYDRIIIGREMTSVEGLRFWPCR
jgi:hypothetical protein